MPLERFFTRQILSPLGVDSVGFRRLPEEPDDDAQASAAGNVAPCGSCEWRDTQSLVGEVQDENCWAMGGVSGHAGLFGTADDVVRFGSEMLAASRDESELFAAETAREFFRRQDLTPDSDWALGWDTPTEGGSSSGQHFGPHSIGHLGFTGTSLWIDLEREAVVVMLTNRVHQVAKKSKFGLRPVVHDSILEAFEAA